MNISVIIPVYNIEQYIERCLHSIMNQTYTEGVECIMVNDCSTDRSVEIAEGLLKDYRGNIQFHIISHERNRGVAAARNTGLTAAKGDYIQFVDGDDYVEPDMLETLYKEAVKTGADMVTADFLETYEDHEEYVKQTAGKDTKECLERFAAREIRAALWVKFIKRELIVKNGLSFIEGQNYGEDERISFFLIYHAGKIVHVAKAFVHYVKYNPSSYSAYPSVKSLEDAIANLSDIERELKGKKDFDEYKAYLYRMQMNLKFTLLVHSEGNIQKRWNRLFRNAYCQVFHADMRLHWKIALLGTYFNMMGPFNLLRNIIQKIKKEEFIYYSDKKSGKQQ